jgi:hypothetical protein
MRIHINYNCYTSQNFNKINAKFVKQHGPMQNMWDPKCKNDIIFIYNFYINDVSFLLVML